MTDCFINISVKTYNPVHTEERKFNSITEAIGFLEAYKIVARIK
jgi:hypothetical protein